MNPLRQLIIAFDYQNTLVPVSAEIQIFEFLRGEKDKGTLINRQAVPLPQVDRISVGLCAKYKVPPQEIKTVVRNDGRLDSEKFECFKLPCSNIFDCRSNNRCRKHEAMS